MKIWGRYDLIKNGASIVCYPVNSIRTYETQDQIFSNSWYITVLKVDMQDIQFIAKLMQISKEEGHLAFAIFDKQINIDVMSQIVQMAKTVLSDSFTKLIIPVEVATKQFFPDYYRIGAFYVEDDNSIVAPQGFNAGSLQYGQFKMILPEANRISKQIESMGLNDLEAIVFIDNWFQKEVQYIIDKESNALGEIYYCPQIDRQATVSDVLLNHFGTCEGITVSIATILSFLNIEYQIVLANDHAWLLVNYDGSYYVWDCTRNITRSKFRMPNALKALAYSYEYTLIGDTKYPEDYLKKSMLLPEVSTVDYPREELQSAIENLSTVKQVEFTYDDKPIYYSLKK